jgi:hypothetical protein
VDFANTPLPRSFTFSVHSPSEEATMHSHSRSPLTRPGVALLALLVAGGCDLDLQNPNAPTEEEVLNSPDGLIAVAVGMQGQFAGMVEDYVLTSALVTDEWGTRTRALVSYQSLLTGENFDPGYGVVEAPWAGAYRVVKSANTLLAGAPTVLEGGLETGVVALAKLLKAMALGTVILNYEQGPIDVTVTAPVPQPRAVILDTILTLLESARTDLQGVTDPDLAVFNARVLGAGFQLRNTVSAMLARYYLIDGQYQNAIDAANGVNLTQLSVFRYVTPNSNPIYALAIGLLYVAPLRSWAPTPRPATGGPTTGPTRRSPTRRRGTPTRCCSRSASTPCSSRTTPRTSPTRCGSSRPRRSRNSARWTAPHSTSMRCARRSRRPWTSR